jgi:hypothetical protein
MIPERSADVAANPKFVFTIVGVVKLKALPFLCAANSAIIVQLRSRKHVLFEVLNTIKPEAFNQFIEYDLVHFLPLDLYLL